MFRRASRLAIALGATFTLAAGCAAESDSRSDPSVPFTGGDAASDAEDASGGDDATAKDPAGNGRGVELEAGVSDATSDAPNTPWTYEGGTDEGDAGGDASELYDPGVVPKFELVLDPAAIAILANTATDDASRNAYAHVTFKFGAVTLFDVGVRRKGSSSFRSYPAKMSLKIKFDKFVKGRRFRGLTDLTLNNMVADSTFLAERLGYHVFRSAGLPAPRANAAELSINGASFGLYANVETPNRDFLDRLGTEQKTLFEANSGSTWLPGTEGAFEIDEGVDTGDLAVLFSTVQGASSATLLQDVAPHLDTTAWLTACALEALTGQLDGYAYGKYGSRNYFLTGTNDAVFRYVPWSLDRTFTDNDGILNAAMPGAVIPGQPALRTLFWRCSQSTSCWAAYRSTMANAIALFEGLALVDLATAWHAQIDALARTDPKREFDLARYESETSKLYGWLAAQPSRVKTQLGLP